VLLEASLKCHLLDRDVAFFRELFPVWCGQICFCMLIQQSLAEQHLSYRAMKVRAELLITFFSLSRWWQKSKPGLHFNGLANVRPNCLGHCDEQPGNGSHAYPWHQGCLQPAACSHLWQPPCRSCCAQPRGSQLHGTGGLWMGNFYWDDRKEKHFLYEMVGVGGKECYQDSWEDMIWNVPCIPNSPILGANMLVV